MAVGTATALLAMRMAPVKCAHCGNTRTQEQRQCKSCGSLEIKPIQPVTAKGAK